MKMKRRFQQEMCLWKIIVGCVLCVLLEISMFIPMFRVSEKDLALATIDATESSFSSRFYNTLEDEIDNATQGDNLLSKLGNFAGGAAVDELREQLQKKFAEEREYVKEEEDFSEYSWSGVKMLFRSSGNIKENIIHASELSGGINDKVIEQISDKLGQFIMLYKVRMAFCLIAPVILLFIILISGVLRWKIMIPSIATCAYLGVYGILQLIWYVVIPGRIASGINQYVEAAAKESGVMRSVFREMESYGVDTDKIVSSMAVSRSSITRVIKTFDGSGNRLLMVAAILLIVWLVAVVMVMPSRAVGVDMLANTTSVYSNATGMNMVNTNVNVANANVVNQNAANNASMANSTVGNRPSGVVMCEEGSLKGAQIDIAPGESVAIGRDPAFSQLILDNPKVSRRHCIVTLDGTGEFYIVACYSKNGIQLSNGQQLLENQQVEVTCNVKLFLADATEVIGLYEA